MPQLPVGRTGSDGGLRSRPADPPGLPVEPLEAYLLHALPDLLQCPLTAELVAGGRSNLTYLLSDGHARWVLRRPPLGHVLETAHDMSREHRVLAALSPTDVPVPRPLLLAGSEVLGAPFYVMEFADGEVLRDASQLGRLDTAAARSLATELVDVLARLHRLDPDYVGLGDLGRPQGYLERQLRRWSTQLTAGGSRDLPELNRLAARLGERLPTTQASAVVHGDYRLDNVIVDRSTGRVVAVLDWEMATLGDPLADLASTAVWWDGLSGLDSPVAAVPGDTPGFPTREHLLATYAERSGAGSTSPPCPGTSASRCSRSPPSSRASTPAPSGATPSARASTASARWFPPSSSEGTTRSTPRSADPTAAGAHSPSPTPQGEP